MDRFDRAAIVAQIRAAIASAAAGHRPAPLGATNRKVDTGAVERTKQMIARLRSLSFCPYLDANGALLIADTTGRGRDVSRYLPIGKVFDDIVAGLAEDQGLVNKEER